ncbi:ACP S-malonyltransferase [Limosilactobacillus sp. pH52_RY]|uniref:ACP S-malonyltransferase n=1 Tax=Limosilactobacillus balticus TaxID=2759747 RepID=UPI0015F7F9FD|nr:ACP S-malonyltransferase [Limosilactobacillus balticus]MBB1110738.1 ACP S-malonyltransferase [Limosilactobacillus balticus]
MKLGIVFSGQGAQKAKMGIEFLNDPVFKQLVQTATRISKLNILKNMESANDELTKTVNLQPTLTTLNIGLYKMLKRDTSNLKVSCMGGLSLGEYSALIASNAIDFEQGIRLLVDRGKYMQEVANDHKGSMLAIINPNMEKIKDICNLYDVEIANYNSPNQIVIGGIDEKIKQAKKVILEEEAAFRVVELNVNGAFHTSLFSKVKGQLANSLKKVTFNEPKIPVLSNTISKPFTKQNISEILAKQVTNPTYFAKNIESMKKDYGVTHIVQIGPGKALTSFIKQSALGIKTYNIATLKDYQRFLTIYSNFK